MICPRCESNALIELDRDGVTIDRCERCRGIWLDRGELEKLIGRAREPEPARVAAPERRHDRDDDDDDDDRRRGSHRRWWDILD